jgi:hypothetical protein
MLSACSCRSGPRVCPDFRLDPPAYVAEVAWRESLFEVVSTGNRGYGSPKLSNPATESLDQGSGEDSFVRHDLQMLTGLIQRHCA